MTRKVLVTLAAGSILMATSQLLVAQVNQQSTGSYDPSAKLTLDPLVTTGVLSNGIHYYIRPNHYPLKRAELRLAVNAGSVLEAQDQLGLAHMTEHMAFNGTAHFPKQDTRTRRSTRRCT